MSIILTDPPSGTFYSTYGAGTFWGQDGSPSGNWANALNGGADNWLNITSGGNAVNTAGGGERAYTAAPNVAFGLAVTQWAEMTLANAIGTSTGVAQGPICFATGSSTSNYNAYIVQMYYSSGSAYDIYAFTGGSAHAISTANAYTAGANDVLALQVVPTNSSTADIYVWNNNSILKHVTDTSYASTIFAGSPVPGFRFYKGVSGNGDTAQLRFGTGSYPPSLITGQLPPFSQTQFFDQSTIVQT
jgi:hypothetical protein